MTAMNGLSGGPHLATASPVRRCLDTVAASVRIVLGPPRSRAELWPLTWPQFAVIAGILLAIFIVCMTLLDAPATRAATHLPEWMTWSFDQITDFGKSGWFLYPLGVLFLLLAALHRNKLSHMSQTVVAAVTVRVGFLFLAIGAPGLTVSIVKRMIGRARPLVDGTVDPYHFAPFIWRSDFASLPSGHATTAFSVLVAFGTLWPRARTVLWIYALAIVLSRVALAAHFPSDVFAGALCGTFGAMLVRRWFALRRLGFSVGPGRVPHQFPGPSRRRIKAVARELLAP